MHGIHGLIDPQVGLSAFHVTAISQQLCSRERHLEMTAR